MKYYEFSQLVISGQGNYVDEDTEVFVTTDNEVGSTHKVLAIRGVLNPKTNELHLRIIVEQRDKPVWL